MPNLLWLGAVLLCCFVGYLILCFRAEEPKKGTLEWISMYEKPGFHVAHHPLERSDWGAAAGAFFLQVAAYSAVVLLTMPQLSPVVLLPTLLSAGACGALCYLLVKRLVGSRSAALTSAILLAGSWSYDPHFFLVCGGVILVGVLLITRKEDSSGGSFALLWGILSAVGLFLYPQILPLIVWALLLLLGDGIARMKKGELWVLLLNVLCFLFAGFLCLSCLVAAGYLSEGISVMDALQKGGFMKSITLCFRGFSLFSLPHSLRWAEIALYTPAALLSVGGCVFLLHSAMRRREAETLAAGLAVLALLIVAVFSTPQCLILAGALSLGYMTGRLFHRGALAHGAVGAAFWTAATFAISLSMYF